MTTRRLSIYPNSQSFEDSLFELQRNFSTLARNLRELDGINENLLTFNNNFSIFLQGLRLNSECLEFPEAPNPDSYTLAKRPRTPPTPEPLPEYHEDHTAATNNPYMQENQDAVSAIPRAKSSAGRQGQKKVVIKTVKRRKPVFQTRKITDLLASRFKDQPHKGVIEQILKELHINRDGMYVHEIVRDIGGGLTRSKCMDYLNALVRTEAVIRVNRKGHLFLLDPEKYPR